MVGSGDQEEDRQQHHHHHHHHLLPSELPLGFRAGSRPASPAAMIASSSMSKESSSYDMADFDQASLFLYLDSHDQQSIQEQRQTLNIFPSQPMHVADPVHEAKSAGVAMAMLPNGNQLQVLPSPNKSPDQQGGQKITSSAPTNPSSPNLPLPNSAKDNKTSLIKKEGTSSGKGATSSDPEIEGRRILDPKTLRRLAQNREAARKSRLRKKAYIQQLESSRIRLSQLEQQVHAARVQGALLGTGDQHQVLPSGPSAASLFDMEYGRWVEEHSKLIFQLRAALNEQMAESQLQVFVSGAMAQHDELLSLKGAIARADIFHLLCGVWASPAERCFLWLGGFRPSEAIKVMLKQVEPVSEGQLMSIYELQQSVKGTEDALSHAMDSLHHSLSDTVAAPDVAGAGGFMGHMSLAINKISAMEDIVRQADGLRQQTLHKLQHMLTVRQAARCFVAISDYFHRLRALSTLWVARPRQEEGGPAM
uniref:DOG1 domain-containing protein n=1 Tax=Oryza brachyantha TaxID=4533 RepID=J3MW50_ORYBR